MFFAIIFVTQGEFSLSIFYTENDGQIQRYFLSYDTFLDAFLWVRHEVA